MSSDVIDFFNNGSLFHSNGAALLNVLDPYDFTLTQGTTESIWLLDLGVLLLF